MRGALSRLAQHPQGSQVGDQRAPSYRCAKTSQRGRRAVLRTAWLGWRQRRASQSESLSVFTKRKRQIRDRLRGLPGVWIEDKAPAFAVHCRDASSTIAFQVAAVVRQVAGALASDLRLLRGLKVWEVLTRDLKGKGAAITGLMAGLPPDALAIYLGDDA